MESILTTVLPVFGMIVLGYGFTRAKIFDATAGRGLSLFVFNLAIPALLFKTVATMGAQQGAPWELWIAFFGGLFITWVAAALVSRTQAQWGRKKSFQTGLVVAFFSCALALWALMHQWFWLLVAATFIAGYYSANAQLYRFAAAELAPVQGREKASNRKRKACSSACSELKRQASYQVQGECGRSDFGPLEVCRAGELQLLRQEMNTT